MKYNRKDVDDFRRIMGLKPRTAEEHHREELAEIDQAIDRQEREQKLARRTIAGAARLAGIPVDAAGRPVLPTPPVRFSASNAVDLTKAVEVARREREQKRDPMVAAAYRNLVADVLQAYRTAMDEGAKLTKDDVRKGAVKFFTDWAVKFNAVDWVKAEAMAEDVVTQLVAVEITPAKQPTADTSGFAASRSGGRDPFRLAVPLAMCHHFPTTR